LQVYVLLYVAMAIYMVAWVVPSAIVAVLPISWKQFFKHSREPLLVAFTTQSVFIALPLIGKKVRAILRDLSKSDNPGELAKTQISYVDVILPIIFAFPHLGGILGLSFIEFTGWNFASPLTGPDLLKLAGLGLPALFSDINAFPFLLRQFHLPRDA